MDDPELRKLQLGDSEGVIKVLGSHGGEMRSGELRKELGVDGKTFRGYLNLLKRAGLIRFSDWFPYEDNFRVRLVKRIEPVATDEVDASNVG